MIRHRLCLGDHCERISKPAQNAVICFIFCQEAKETLQHYTSVPLQSVYGVVDPKTIQLGTAFALIERELLVPRASLRFHRSGRPFFSQCCHTHHDSFIHPFAFWLDQYPDQNMSSARGPGARENPISAWKKRRDQWPQLSGKCPCAQQGLQGIFFEALLEPASAVILGQGLQRLRTDHESGARKLAAIALNIFQEVLDNLPDPVAANQTWWDKSLHVAWHIWKNGRPSMGAAILSFELLVLERIQRCSKDPCSCSGLDRREILRIFSDVQDEMRRFTAGISTHFASYTQLQATISERPQCTLKILTLSSSSTIRECIVQAVLASKAESIEIRLLESRPLFEGVSMATSILNRLQECHHKPNCHLNIFTDAQMALAAYKIDFLLLGADRIGSDGSVSNKIGSLPAALSVRHISPKAKIVVASEIYKVSPDPYDHVVSQHTEDNGPAEVIQSWSVGGMNKEVKTIQGSLGTVGPCQVGVRNAYFERIPSSLIDVYICETGVADGSVFRDYFREATRRYRRYFGDTDSG